MPSTLLLEVPRLARGARVALVSPAGPLRGAAELARAVQTCVSLDLEPVALPHALACHGYLAGDDAGRIADLNHAFRDPAVDAIWCLRGGYGVTRLLDRLDFDALRARPRAVIGYSDITALLAACGTHAGLVSFHGPTARQVLTPFSERHLRRALLACEADGTLELPNAAPDRDASGDGEVTVLSHGIATGPLAGGNLALLASLAGTPYFPSLDGAILVLEDVGEAVYRIDRMLSQLRLGGHLDRLAGVVLGHFTEIPGEPGEITLQDVMHHYFARLGIPVIMGAPVGHVDDQWTLPLGAPATLVTDPVRLTLHPLGRR